MKRPQDGTVLGAVNLDAIALYACGSKASFLPSSRSGCQATHRVCREQVRVADIAVLERDELVPLVAIACALACDKFQPVNAFYGSLRRWDNSHW